MNCAGATRLGCGIANTSVEEFQWHMDVNVKSTFIMTQKCLVCAFERMASDLMSIDQH